MLSDSNSQDPKNLQQQPYGLPNQKRFPRPGLGPIDIDIDHAAGTHRTHPNGLITMAMKNELVPLIPVPGVVSDASGKPAVVYATNELVLSVTPEELHRLVMLDLTPQEFFALKERYGVFFEIHEDFYSPATGAAVQPRGRLRPGPSFF